MKSGSTVKVFIVDDDPGMRNSSQLVMTSAGLNVAAYSSGEDFLDDYRANHPGCLLLDLRMPGISGMQVVERLRAANMKLPVIMLTGHGDVPTAVDAMKLGILDFLEKPVDHRVLVEKVRAALDLDAAQRLQESGVQSVRARFAALTAREREMLQLLIAGKSSKQVAAELGISIKTVANHRASLMAKTGASNAADLVRLSMIAGI